MRFTPRLVLTLSLPVLFAISVVAQTSAFTYQGRLTDNSAAANGTYQMQFLLFDSDTNGGQVGFVENPAVSVVSGVFTAQLDFGPDAFPGAERYLQISVRRNSSESFVVLTPRINVTSVPYSTKAASAGTADTATNATQLGGITSDQYVTTADPRLSDARDPLAGSNNYIQAYVKGAPQTADFTINGIGSANAFSAGQFNIFGQRALAASQGGKTLYVGQSAGAVSTAVGNSFVGVDSGANNTTGGNNSFLGAASGFSNTTGQRNSMFGRFAGNNNTTGSSNSFFGYSVAFSNMAGSNNSFFGDGAGIQSNGSNNTFVGQVSGFGNETGNSNTAIGYFANVGSTNLSFATAIGANSVVSSSNTIALGRSDGSDKIVIYGLGAAGATPLCRNASNQIATCSSPLTREAFEAQRSRIEAMQKELEQQRQKIELLIKLVCLESTAASVCGEVN